jgi:hypothetical protein
MNTAWSESYPAKAALRREVQAMVDAVLHVLLREIGEDVIRGVYFKGSGQREWDTLLDYVPELSDVDIHVWLDDERWAESGGIDLETSLRIQAGIEHAFRQSITDPIHLPRPQIIPLNQLKQDIEYVPPPPGGVQVIYGENMPADGHLSTAEIRRIDANSLAMDGEAVALFPLKVIDRPGRYIWTALAYLSWRVSPTGARVLDLLGMDPDETWNMNRTAVMRALRALEQDLLADRLSEYYVRAWDFFLSGYQDIEAARQAIRSGADAITIACEVVAPIALSLGSP